MWLTQKRLREFLRYDPKTGIFLWIRLPSYANRIRIGDKAGHTTLRGYIKIRLFGKLYSASRLAFFYMECRWPKNEIDHKDRNPSNNTWSNLRKASHMQNMRNKKKYLNNKSGYKG